MLIKYNIVDDNIIELNNDDLIEYNKYLDEQLKEIKMTKLEIEEKTKQIEKERIDKEILHNKTMELLELQIKIEKEKQTILREKIEKEKQRIKEEKEENNKPIKNKTTKIKQFRKIII